MANGTTTRGARIYTITSLGEAQIDTRVRGLAALDEEQARALTTQIQRTSARLWLLVTEAHDRKAHIALGYETWADYVKAELSMSESRSYQYLDTGHVMKALAGAGVDVEDFNPPPTRVIARVKDRLTDVRKAAENAIKKDESIDAAIRSLAREPRKPGKPEEPPEDDVGPKGENGGEEEVDNLSQRRAAKQVSCPACAGSGKVTQSVADRLLNLINRSGTKI